MNVYRWLSARLQHYNDVIMSAMASQITSLTIVNSTVYSGTDQRKHQSSASMAFVWGIHWWPVNSPHKWPVTRKMLPFDDIMSNSIANALELLQSFAKPLICNIYVMQYLVLMVHIIPDSTVVYTVGQWVRDIVEPPKLLHYQCRLALLGDVRHAGSENGKQPISVQCLSFQI